MAKRNPDKAAQLPPEGNAFDLAFEPLIEIMGATATRISPLEMLTRRRYRDALGGNAPAIRTMLTIGREDAKARADADSPHLIPHPACLVFRSTPPRGRRQGAT